MIFQQESEMKMTNYIATPSRTQSIIKKHQFSIKKILRQYFLIDVNILARIIDSAGIDSNSNVIEIGPGIGSLTEQHELKADKVVPCEIDERLKPVLESALSPYDNFRV